MRPIDALIIVCAEFAHSGGHCLDDSQEACAVPNDADLEQHPHGVKEWALDPAAAQPCPILSGIDQPAAFQNLRAP